MVTVMPYYRFDRGQVQRKIPKQSLENLGRDARKTINLDKVWELFGRARKKKTLTRGEWMDFTDAVEREFDRNDSDES
jgi:hypothetical protein